MTPPTAGNVRPTCVRGSIEIPLYLLPPALRELLDTTRWPDAIPELTLTLRAVRIDPPEITVARHETGTLSFQFAAFEPLEATT